MATDQRNAGKLSPDGTNFTGLVGLVQRGVGDFMIPYIGARLDSFGVVGLEVVKIGPPIDSDDLTIYCYCGDTGEKTFRHHGRGFEYQHNYIVLSNNDDILRGFVSDGLH